MLTAPGGGCWGCLCGLAVAALGITLTVARRRLRRDQRQARAGCDDTATTPLWSAILYHFGEIGALRMARAVAEVGLSALACASKTRPHEMQRNVRHWKPGRSFSVWTVDRHDRADNVPRIAFGRLG